ncbi:MAG: hypothetical protein QOH59_1715 [Gemmatimonadales bacterium]|nr:hypothetical protein [Gemmatimonadales bacterium]
MVAASPTQLDTFTVALLEPVNWRSLDHALSPTNDSERLLFRNLFHNVIQLDCQGTVRPGIADAWTFDPNAGWTFALPERASFAPGWGATADLVAERVDSAVVLDARHVRVPMRGRDSIPRFLADPALALAPGMASSGGEPGGIELPAPAGATAVYFKFEPNGDGRDVLDRGADLVVTRDPALVDYVSNRAEFATFTLPWSRTYVLAETGSEQGELVRALSTVSVRRSLARDAVRGDARAAEPPYWWSDMTCPSPSTLPAQSPSSRVVYRKDDAVARGLAERGVALASTGAGLRAAGLDEAEFATAVRSGSERAYVIGLPRQSLAPCRDVSTLPAGARLLPLIDTRAHAIVRKGAPPLTVDWDGTLRVMER